MAASLKSLVAVIAVSLIVLEAHSKPLEEHQVSNNNNVGELRHLGDADGKAFYSDLDATLTWDEAEAYCRSNNLSLATVETVEQKNVLVRALYQFGLKGYWFSARESLQVSMLVWDDTRATPDTSVLTRWSFLNPSPASHHYCGLFAIYQNGDICYIAECSRPFSVLCQGESQTLSST